jgi:hypothetical protein
VGHAYADPLGAGLHGRSTFNTLAGSRGVTFNPSSGNAATVSFPAASTRYLRVEITGNTGWPAGQLSEFEVYAS